MLRRNARLAPAVLAACAALVDAARVEAGAPVLDPSSFVYFTHYANLGPDVKGGTPTSHKALLKSSDMVKPPTYQYGPTTINYNGGYSTGAASAGAITTDLTNGITFSSGTGITQFGETAFTSRS